MKKERRHKRRTQEEFIQEVLQAADRKGLTDIVFPPGKYTTQSKIAGFCPKCSGNWKDCSIGNFLKTGETEQRVCCGCFLRTTDHFSLRKELLYRQVELLEKGNDWNTKSRLLFKDLISGIVFSDILGNVQKGNKGDVSGRIGWIERYNQKPTSVYLIRLDLAEEGFPKKHGRTSLRLSSRLRLSWMPSYILLRHAIFPPGQAERSFDLELYLNRSRDSNVKLTRYKALSLRVDGRGGGEGECFQASDEDAIENFDRLLAEITFGDELMLD